jgi:pseudouridine-5'-monophosphatase
MTRQLPRRATHVVFDLDGVLLDTEPLYTRATQEVVSEWGKTFDWAVKQEMMGRDERESAQHLVDALELPISAAEYLSRQLPKAEALFPTVDEKPGAEQFARELHRRGVAMAVATSGVRRVTDLKLQRHGWFEVFGAIVCGDDPRVQRPKPAPDIFLVAAATLGADPADCLVFEDSLAGVRAALAAGMLVVAMPDPNVDSSRFRDAHLVVGGYDELDLDRLGL